MVLLPGQSELHEGRGTGCLQLLLVWTLLRGGLRSLILQPVSFFFFFFALDCPGSLLWHLGSLDAVSGLVAPSHVVSYFLNLSPRHWKVDP